MQYTPSFCVSGLSFVVGMACLTLIGLSTVEVSGADLEVVQRNISYLPQTEDTAHQLDLYLPKTGTSGRRPLLVWIHGGGWAGGDKNDLREQQIGRKLAAEGYVVASINYTLATDEYPTWPKAILDCKNAIRFLRRNAARWEIDPDRISVGGGSAGAHLALLVAYTHGIPEMTPATPYEGERDDVKAVMSFYGATNFLTMQTTDREGRPTGKSVAGRGISRFLGQDRITGGALWKKASPVFYVRPGIPATYLSHGKEDTTIDYLQSVELHDLLRETGIPCEMVLLENTGHTYSFTHRGKELLEKDLTPGILAFLNQYLPASDRKGGEE